MGIFDGCLLACDVDGTLVESGYINPKNIEKIEYFMSEGGMFSLSTGRAASAVSPILKCLKRVSPCVTTNGAMLYDFQNSRIVAESVLPKEDYRIARLVEQLPYDIGIEIHSGLDALVTKRTTETDDHERYEEFDVTFTTFEQASERNWNKVLYTCNNLKEREILKELVSKQETNCDFVETCAVIDGRMRYYFEQLPKGISKISALKKLCSIYNIKKGGLFAIGDYYNDVAMLKEGDVSAATAGAPDDVKCHADYVTVACEDGAVADFIDFLTEKFKK